MSSKDIIYDDEIAIEYIPAPGMYRIYFCGDGCEEETCSLNAYLKEEDINAILTDMRGDGFGSQYSIKTVNGDTVDVGIIDGIERIDDEEWA